MSEAIFIDIETSGLDPVGGAIFEVAFVAVDTSTWTATKSLSALTLTQENSLMVRNPDLMDNFVLNMHKKSGLWDELQNKLHVGGLHNLPFNYAIVEQSLLSELRNWGVKNVPTWGSSVHFDRKWLAHHMPELNSYFHYRVVDSSSTLERLKATQPAIYRAIDDDPTRLKIDTHKHRAAYDVLVSIDIERRLDSHLFKKASVLGDMEH